MDVFVALADPTRRGMLEMLIERDHAAGNFVTAFPGISQPAVSQHLRLLLKAKLVDVRAEAQKRIYSLRPERLQEVDRWIARYRRRWPRTLDALERYLDENPE